jgi:hypothetical protein
MPTIPRPHSARRQDLGVALLTVAVLVLAALRASIGLSFYDDSYYVVIPLRFAHGARLFADELSLQALGEMVSVPFLWVYEAFFGLTGVALFVRELYVVVAATVGAILYRLLRPSARPAAAAVAVIVPLLALPYHLFAPTYNTVTQLCFTLSIVLGWASVRDERPGLAATSGVMLAAGAVAYPPFALAAVVALVTFALVARRRALILAALGGATLSALMLVLAITIGLSLDDMRRAFSFASSNVGNLVSPLDKLRWALGQLGGALINPLLWPMWVLALVASVPLLPKQVRAVALAAIPVAAAVPGVALLARGDGFSFGSATSSWMITATAGIALPSLVWAWGARKRDFLLLILLAAPFALSGFITVAYVTNSSWNRGVGSIALAPLTLGLLLCWSTAMAENWGASLQWTAVAVTMMVAFGLLFANIFNDPLTWTSHALITRGPYAGITTTAGRRDQVSALQSAGKRWVGSTTRVTFLGEREADLAVGGIWDTPAAWLPPAASDRAAIEYFTREGRSPQVVFVDEIAIAREGGYQGGPARDPFLAYVLGNYRKVGVVADFGVFVRN